jgi:hypothetical protein
MYDLICHVCATCSMDGRMRSPHVLLMLMADEVTFPKTDITGFYNSFGELTLLTLFDRA